MQVAPDLKTAFAVLLEQAVLEDLGTVGDVSSDAIFTGQQARARIISRQAAVVYGLWTVPLVAARIDPALRVTLVIADGQQIQPNQVVCQLEGSVASFLKAERIILNFLAYLSGIATMSAEYAALAAKSGTTAVLDTRKTLPGYRLLAKAAVKAGGCRNHRMGLYDMVMIKDNHIDAAGSIEAAVAAVRQRWGSQYRIELECRNLEEVNTGLSLGVDIIMLDNMSPEACVQALELKKTEFASSSTLFEASGDMTREKLVQYAGLGLDYISVGALTHSVKSVNFSMGIEKAGA